MTDRTLSYLPLASLIADPANPKNHALDTIGDSVGRFGYVEPIVRDDRTGYIISGHGRTSTLREMEERGQSVPDGVKVDEDGVWLVPVVTGWSSRSDLDARAALIALNRTTELGGWDDDALVSLLDDLSQMDDGLVGVGFDEGDLAALRALTRTEAGERDLDDLEAEYGGMTDEDGLTKISLRLRPETAEALGQVIDAAKDEDEAIRGLLDLLDESAA